MIQYGMIMAHEKIKHRFNLAMIAVHANLDKDSQLLLQIHDELIVETDEAKGEAVAQLLKETNLRL